MHGRIRDPALTRCFEGGTLAFARGTFSRQVHPCSPTRLIVRLYTFIDTRTYRPYIDGTYTHTCARAEARFLLVRSTGRNTTNHRRHWPRCSWWYWWFAVPHHTAPRCAGPRSGPSSKSPPLTSAERARLTSVRVRPESARNAQEAGRQAGEARQGERMPAAVARGPPGTTHACTRCCCQEDPRARLPEREVDRDTDT